jgi:hypothetical protein
MLERSYSNWLLGVDMDTKEYWEALAKERLRQCHLALCIAHNCSNAGNRGYYLHAAGVHGKHATTFFALAHIAPA